MRIPPNPEHDLPEKNRNFIVDYVWEASKATVIASVVGALLFLIFLIFQSVRWQEWAVNGFAIIVIFLAVVVSAHKTFVVALLFLFLQRYTNRTYLSAAVAGFGFPFLKTLLMEGRYGFTTGTWTHMWFEHRISIPLGVTAVVTVFVIKKFTDLTIPYVGQIPPQSSRHVMKNTSPIQKSADDAE